jgi:hypothetical protein
MCQLKSILKSFKLTLSLHNVLVKQTNSLRNYFLFLFHSLWFSFVSGVLELPIILLHKLQPFDIDVILVLRY